MPDDLEHLFRQVWSKFGREVSASYVGDAASYPWSVMVEGDVGSFAGETLAEALSLRLDSDPPEKTTGWGVDAR